MDSLHQSARLLRALSHPIRLKLLGLLDEDEQCVCHLTASTGKRQAYISQQLAALRAVGLVQMRKEGLRVYYRVNDSRTHKLLCAINVPRGNNHNVRGCECPKCAKGSMRCTSKQVNKP